MHRGSAALGRAPAAPAAIKSQTTAARAEFELVMGTMAQIEAASGHPHVVKVLGCVCGADVVQVLYR